jgi:hypothetical protein
LRRGIERLPPDELGHQIYFDVAGDHLQGLDDILMMEALGDLTLPKSPGTLLRAVDRDDLDGHLQIAPKPSEITLPGTLYTVGSPHGRESASSDHLRECVATLPGSPATYVMRLGHK